jgi:catecholate siderophore receptor
MELRGMLSAFNGQQTRDLATPRKEAEDTKPPSVTTMRFIARNCPCAILALGLASAGALMAQTANPPPPATAATTTAGAAMTPSTGPSSSNIEVLEKVVVSDVALEDQVSPLQRPVSSVLGLEMSILDTPRAITEINSAQIRDESIVDVTDFAKITSSAYTNMQFGGPNVPFLRGQSAEVFQNGMGRTPRSDGQPLSFNSVEGFDVVKGPADVVYGPTGNVGGYVNLVTKRPFFDGNHATITLTYGDYDTQRAQIDVSGPLGEKLAYRVSYEGENSGSYFRFQHTQSSDVYGALKYLPNSNMTIDFNTEFFTANYFENTGINRPTQLLIDKGLYYQGMGVSPFVGPGQDPRNFLSVVTVTGIVPIDRRLGLVAPTDGDEGKNFQAQLDVTDTLNSTVTVVNKAYFEDYTQLQIEYAQRYFNNIKESYNFEDRFEVRGDLANSQFITGVSYRHMHVLAYQDFFNEYLNATDITSNPNNFVISELFGVLPVPGNSDQFGAPGASYASGLFPFAIQGTQDQNSNQFGAFYQHIFPVSKQLSLLAGLRGDIISESLTDPLPPPGFAAAHDSVTEREGAVDLSATYKPVPWNTEYLTADYNESPVTTNGGGFAGFTGDVINPSDFKIKNYLYEAGSKFALLNNTLFLSGAVFHQQRSQTDQFGNVSKIISEGYELEANYQPNRNFSGTMSYSYLNASLPHATGGLAFTENVYDAFAPPYGNGTGSPNFNTIPAGNYRLPGVPRELFSAFAKYRTNMGLGASLGLVVTSPIITSYLGNVVIPTQYNLDGAVFYEAKRWAVRLNLYNITDQKNWSAEAGAIGNDLINADLPFHVAGSVTYRY